MALGEDRDDGLPAVEGGGEAVDEDDRGPAADVEVAQANAVELEERGRLGLVGQGAAVIGQAAREERGEERRQEDEPGRDGSHGASLLTSAASVNSSAAGLFFETTDAHGPVALGDEEVGDDLGREHADGARELDAQAQDREGAEGRGQGAVRVDGRLVGLGVGREDALGQAAHRRGRGPGRVDRQGEREHADGRRVGQEGAAEAVSRGGHAEQEEGLVADLEDAQEVLRLREP